MNKAIPEMKNTKSMRRCALLLSLLLAGASFFTVKASGGSSPRQVYNFNREWKYARGDFEEAGKPGFDDSAWEPVGLPHSFSIPYFLSKDFYVGYGWYRKTFRLTGEEAGKKIFLEFDGVFQEAEAFVNGHAAGSHRGGYTGFSLDISPFVKPGGNVIAVRVNNVWKPDLAPRAGEHVFSGGIYRNVRLVVKEKAYIDWYGTGVTVSGLQESGGAAGTVCITTEVRNDTGEPQVYRLKNEVVSPGGRVVASVQTSEEVLPHAVKRFTQRTGTVRNPLLWHPEHPALYRLVSTLYRGEQAVDRDETTFGFRWFEWTADRGFFLNGEHYYFKGANVHQDHAGWGDAVTETGMYRDVRLMKEAGFDLIRGSHYPHAPAFSQACDELGMLFWAENCFWGTGAFDSPWGGSAYPPEAEYQAGFEASVKQSLAEMIRIHRNHPSIIVWSMSNEPFFTHPSTLEKVRTFLKELVELTHTLDPTRPAAIGGCQRGELDLLGDVAGYNGDGARLFIRPGVASVVSEYGSTIAHRPGEYIPGWGNLPEGAEQDSTQRYPWRYPWRAGEAIWCGFDHGSLGGRFGCMGVVDYFRLPKRQWYWYRNEYRQIPPPVWPEAGVPAALKLETDLPVVKAADGTGDAHLTVTVLGKDGKPVSTNVPVTLTVVSGPGEFPTGKRIAFRPDSDIVIRDGKAAIELRSHYAGTTVVQASSPGLRSAELTLVFKGDYPYEPGKSRETVSRPYVRYVAGMETDGETGLQVNRAKQGPTNAGSETGAHTARLANDGDRNTYWQPSGQPGEAWIRIDLERLTTVHRVRLFFRQEGAYRYRIEVSDDGTRWTEIAASGPDVPPKRVRTEDTLQRTGRFLRVSFLPRPGDAPLQVEEIEVYGTL